MINTKKNSRGGIGEEKDIRQYRRVGKNKEYI
jgi:hypothetical protein